MTKITMELIKELREKTQIGMMDCKKALIESGGDIEKAIEILRKKGALVAAKRAGSKIDNGHIQACISEDLKSGALLKIACETDFSAKTKEMKDFAAQVCKIILQKNPTYIDEKDDSLLQQSFDSRLTVGDKLHEIIAKIAENIKIQEFTRFQIIQGNGLINTYTHPGENIGSMVELICDKDIGSNLEKIKQLAYDLCMQITVSNPISIGQSDLNSEIIEKELYIIKEQLAASGKPANIIEKISQGKINKFYEEVCLLNQKYIKDDKISVKKHIEEIEKITGLKIEVKNFQRFSVGK